MTHDRHQHWGEPIERGKIEPREIETEEKKSPKPERVETGAGALEEARKIALKRIKRSELRRYLREGAIALLGVAEERIPIIRVVTEPLKNILKPTNQKIMPKDKAILFLQKFSQAEGVFKYVYGVVAIVLFGVAFLAPQYGIPAVAVAYGLQSGKAYYEEQKAKEAIGD